MLLAILGLLVLFASATCWTLVILHGFQRSLGTGFMVLLLPVVNIVYGFRQFEHRRKGLILAVWIGGLPVGIVLRTLAAA